MTTLIGRPQPGTANRHSAQQVPVAMSQRTEHAHSDATASHKTPKWGWAGQSYGIAERCAEQSFSDANCVRILPAICTRPASQTCATRSSGSPYCGLWTGRARTSSLMPGAMLGPVTRSNSGSMRFRRVGHRNPGGSGQTPCHPRRELGDVPVFETSQRNAFNRRDGLPWAMSRAEPAATTRQARILPAHGRATFSVADVGCCRLFVPAPSL